jgi:hypothetical protein
VQERIAAVQLESGVDDLFLVLRRRQLCLIVRVRDPLARRPRLRQPGEPGPDAGARQVLRLAVVLVPAAVLAYVEVAHLGHVEVANGAHPPGKVHEADAG